MNGPLYTGVACSEPGCQRYARTLGRCPAHYERLRRHGNAQTTKVRARHEGSPTGSGYWHTMHDGQRKQDHVWVAERALGKPLPPESIVHHVDENPLNNEPSNLVICPSRAYHALIHTRMRALAESGHADWRKCWICKCYDAPGNMAKVERSQGAYFQHNTCRNQRYQQAKEAHHAA